MTLPPVCSDRNDFADAQQKMRQLVDESFTTAFAKNIAADAQFVTEHIDDADAFVPGTPGDVALQNLREAIATGGIGTSLLLLEAPPAAVPTPTSEWKHISFVPSRTAAPADCAECMFSFASVEPASLDPQMSLDLASLQVVYQNFESLLTVGRGDNPLYAPGVAESFDVSPNHDVYVFHLRRDARWSNGDAITTADFLYAWERCLNPSNARLTAHQLYPLRNAREYYTRQVRDFSQVGVRAIDAYTLEVTLAHPDPEFPVIVASEAGYLPVPKKTIDAFGDLWTRPEHIVCNGAYCLDSQSQEKIVLRKNSRYWGHDRTQVTTATMYIAAEETLHLQWYGLKKIDWVWRVPLGAIEHIAREADDGLRHDVKQWPGAMLYAFPFNVHKPPFDDVRVRGALAAALDRRALAKIFSNTVQATTNIVPPLYKDSHGYTSPPAPYLDRLSAQMLLAQAGFSAEHPLHFSLVYNTSDIHRPVAEYFQRTLEETFTSADGKMVFIEPRNMEWKPLLALLQAKDFEVTRMGIQATYPSPLSLLEIFRSDNEENISVYSNPLYDQLLDTIETTSDPATRAALYGKAESMLMRDWPIIPAFIYGGFQLVRDNIHGFDFTPTGTHLFKYVRVE